MRHARHPQPALTGKTLPSAPDRAVRLSATQRLTMAVRPDLFDLDRLPDHAVRTEGALPFEIRGV